MSPCSARTIDRATGKAVRCIREGRHCRHSDGCLEWQRSRPGSLWRVGIDPDGRIESVGLLDEFVLSGDAGCAVHVEAMDDRTWTVQLGGGEWMFSVRFNCDGTVRVVLVDGPEAKP